MSVNSEINLVVLPSIVLNSHYATTYRLQHPLGHCSNMAAQAARTIQVCVSLSRFLLNV